MDVLPYGRQQITDADIKAVVDVLRSDFLTQGPAVPAFEQALKARCRAGYAVAVNSATSALHIACLALGVGPGDWVWTSPVTFVATANCALYCGASVDFVDIDPRTYCLSVDRLAEKLAQAQRTGRLPKVVIVVHLCGQPSEMAAIQALSARYGFRIIEDASHAVGAKYKGNPVGDGQYSDITVFSFHPVKIMTTGEGGAALTNQEALAKRMSLLRNHGITRDASEMTAESEGPWYYQQIDLGFNYRMTDIHAALGLSQLTRLDTFVARRHQIAERYDEALCDLPVVTPWQHPDGYSSLHLYVIRLKLEAMQRPHRTVFESLRASGIGVNLHYIPIYRQPYYVRRGFVAGSYPEAERYYAEAISLPIYPGLTGEQQDRVIGAVRKALTS